MSTVLQARCPKCLAKPGKPCKTARGAKTQIVHVARRKQNNLHIRKELSIKYEAAPAFGKYVEYRYNDPSTGVWTSLGDPGEPPSHWFLKDNTLGAWSIWDYSNLPGYQSQVPIEVSMPKELNDRGFDHGRMRVATLEEAFELMPLLMHRMPLVMLLDARIDARIEALEKLAGYLVP